MGSVVGEVTGANRRAANAAARAGRAQESAANKQFQRFMDLTNRAFTESDSPQELQALTQSLQAGERDLARQEALARALDPAIIEAATQAVNLLKGQESSALAPLKSQRERQRQGLLNQLRQQLGPGAESSQAGLNALAKFDQQTSEILGSAQQQSLEQLLGSAGSLSSVSQQFGNAGARLGQIGQAFGDRARGRASILGNAGASGLGQSSAQLVGSAGGRFAGQLARAQQMQGIGNDLFAVGSTLGLGGLTGGASMGLGTGKGSALAGLFGSKFEE